MSKNEGIEPGVRAHKRRVEANSSAASKLACCLGIAGLKYLDDEEAGRLIDFIRYLSGEAAEEGFRDGWNCGRAFAECDYNGDGLKLLGVGPMTTH